MRHGLLIAGVLIGVGAFGPVAAAAQTSHPSSTEAQQSKAGDVFAPLRQDWARNLHDKRIDASAAEYAADADFLDPGGNRMHGTAAIRQLIETVTGTYDSDLTFNSQRVEVSGDRGYDSGSYKELLTVRATGKAQYSSGSYMTIYHRGKDGAWLIAEQMWTGAISDAPLPAPLPLDPHPVVALTFDDLPSAGVLPAGESRARIATELAAELKANHLEGTYGFVNAVHLENDPDAQQALRIWVDAGMKLGNHTWSHMSLKENTVEAFEHEIALGEPALAQYAGGSDWHWFRYPYLAEGETLEKRNAVRAWLKDHGYRAAEVTLSFGDYAWNDAYVRCLAKHDTAAIAWLRQSYLESAAEYTAFGRQESEIVFHGERSSEIPHVMLLHAMSFTTLMLPELLDMLRREGFRFASLPEVEQDPVYSLNPDFASQNGASFLDLFMNSRHLAYPPVKPEPFDKLNSLCQ